MAHVLAALMPTFLSTPSARRATLRISSISMLFTFLSTPSARRATDDFKQFMGEIDISIHALREEGDIRNPIACIATFMISIHALREEGDRGKRRCGAGDLPFLSTPSARRATSCRGPASPRRGISIHALREEGDRPRSH